MFNNKRDMLIFNIIFYAIISLIILLATKWQAKVDNMSAAKLIEYIYQNKLYDLITFSLAILFVIYLCFIVLIFVETIDIRKKYSTTLACFSLILSICCGVFMVTKIGYRYNLSYSYKIASYIVPKSRIKKLDDGTDRYQLVSPKTDFVNIQVLKSTTGYDQIDNHTFKINGKRITINNSNNVIRHRSFNNSQHSITYIKYTWKSGVSPNIKKAFINNFGKLSKLNTLVINE